jgi:hypothetical protein
LVAAAFIDTNPRVLSDLELDPQVLDLIQENFLKMLHLASLCIHSFQEGRGLTGVKGLCGKVSVQQAHLAMEIY